MRITSRLTARLPERLRDPVRRAWRSVVFLLPTAARLPAVELELRPWLPCWLLRLLAVAVALLSSALVIRGPFGWTVVVVLALVVLIRPVSAAAVVLVCCLGFALLQAPPQPWGVREPLLLLGTHTVVVLCILLGRTSWTARVHPAVLLRPAPRFVMIQLVAQLTGIAGALLAGRDLSWPWIPAVAALATLGLLIIWLPRLGGAAEPDAPRAPIPAYDDMARRWGDE